MNKIFFLFHDRKYTIKDSKGLKMAIEYIFLKENKELLKLNYIFCSDKFLLSINKEFLQHDYFTDIITFDLSGFESQIEGEIYISLDRVFENAKNLKIPTRTEICRVAFHGALHLCGYSDKTKNEKIRMRKKEDEYLTHYFKRASS